MVSGPITSWQMKGGKWKQWQVLFFGAPKPLQIVDCSHEIKRQVLLGRKAMTNLDSILKSGGIILPTKVSLVKAMVFPVLMYGGESWSIKKDECRRIDAFELCWRRLLGIKIKPVNPIGNQPWIFTGRTDAEVEAPKLWSPDAKSRCTGKDTDARKD